MVDVKQRELLWTSSNDYDTEIKYAKGTTTASANQGVCSGLSAEWCKNILNGVRAESSKPFLLQGLIYQRFYDWGSDREERNAKVMATAGLSQTAKVNYSTAQKTAAGLWADTGVFLVGLTNHKIAYANTAGTNNVALLFDPNYGCYAVHSESRLKELLRQARTAVGAGIPMDTRKVVLA